MHTPGDADAICFAESGLSIPVPSTFGAVSQMANANPFEEIARNLGNLLPPGLNEMKEDVEKNLRAGLQSTFSNLDLVTREEFDVQGDVLQRALETIRALEARVRVLEEQAGVSTPEQ